MRKFFILLFTFVLPMGFSTSVCASDFAWLNQLSVEAQADPAGFAARLSTRFHIGSAEVTAVIDKVGNQADAYMVMRLAEMSHHSISYVSEEYTRYPHQGWGALAKSLGIKPGSREFHTLKAGQDLYVRNDDYRKMGNGNGHAHGQGNGKHRHKKQYDD